MSSWGHHVYNELSDVLVPVTGAFARETLLYTEHRNMLRAHMSDDDDLSLAHRELISYFVAMRGGGRLVNLDTMRVVANRLMDQLFELDVGFVCAAECLSHILEVRMPCIHLFNEIVFNALMKQNLEPERRQRVDLKHDRWLFVYLSLQYEFVEGPISESMFRRWVNRAVRTLNFMSPAKALSMLTDSSSSIKGIVGFYECRLRQLRWRQRRKSRKRRRDSVECLGDCCVCFETKSVVRTACDHMICKTCMNAWAKSTCPVCRRGSYV